MLVLAVPPISAPCKDTVAQPPGTKVPCTTRAGGDLAKARETGDVAHANLREEEGHFKGPNHEPENFGQPRPWGQEGDSGRTLGSCPALPGCRLPADSRGLEISKAALPSPGDAVKCSAGSPDRRGDLLSPAHFGYNAGSTIVLCFTLSNIPKSS